MTMVKFDRIKSRGRKSQFEMVAILHILNTGKEQARIYKESFTKKGAVKECKAFTSSILRFIEGDLN